ncbi:TPA: resolvase, partial [Streptococcus suis]|nr:resolvase [Streptococcus suis]
MKKIIKQYQEKGSVVIGYARVSSTDNRQELG